jgi:hypothetical protein
MKGENRVAKSRSSKWEKNRVASLGHHRDKAIVASRRDKEAKSRRVAGLIKGQGIKVVAWSR